jgi:uncharacterized protein (DUF488 family)
MLTRQKIILALLAMAGRPLKATTFVKFVFLLRRETLLAADQTFYEFVPYRFGPFSFSLYRDLGELRLQGYIGEDEGQISFAGQAVSAAKAKASELLPSHAAAIGSILRRYGRLSQRSLIQDVYARYPWFASRSELADALQTDGHCRQEAAPAVFTVGYEGKSVDAFFNRLMEAGVAQIIDVRANPISRKYGFSRLRLGEIAPKLGIDYCHWPTLGVPGAFRAGLSDFASYQRLLQQYERNLLSRRNEEVAAVGTLMSQRPSVLLCVEKDVRCCHRSRLAEAVAGRTALEIVHL